VKKEAKLSMAKSLMKLCEAVMNSEQGIVAEVSQHRNSPQQVNEAAKLLFLYRVLDVAVWLNTKAEVICQNRPRSPLPKLHIPVRTSPSSGYLLLTVR
jgi:hypothetical protein